MDKIITESPIDFAQAQKMLLNISKPTLRKFIREGRVRAHKLGGKYAFLPSEILEDVKKC